MTFKNVEEIKAEGFEGFLTIEDLMVSKCADVPKIKGIYFVLKLDGRPQFLTTNVGGHFKKRNPTLDLAELKPNWVDDTIVIYIGQGGGGNSKKTLNARLKEYMRFGQGKPVGHWGGRLIWQLKNHKKLIICWKSTPKEDPRIIEKSLISDFIKIYGNRPFANLQG